MIKIPNTNKQWQYSVLSDVMGNVVDCHNITFDKQGYATLNSKMGEMTGDDTNIGTVKAFVTNGSSVHAITTDEIYTTSFGKTQTTPIFSDAGETQGGASSHGVYWNGYTVYTDSSRLITWDGSTDTNRNTGLTSSSDHHPVCVFESANKIAVGDVNVVKLFNTSWALDTVNQLTIPANYIVTWIRFLGGFLYIGTKNISNENAKMFVWNGTGTTASNAFDCGGVWSWAGDVYGSTIVQINSRGQLMEYTGNGFKELASLPVYYTQQIWRDSGGFVCGKIVTDGLRVDGDNIFISLDGEIVQSANESQNTELKYIPNQPSGVWCYDPKVGLYPFSLASADTLLSVSISAVNTTTNTFTGTHTFKTGDKIRYRADSASTGLTSGSLYFIIKVSGTEFKLANTYDDAIAGTAIDITASGTTETIIGYRHTDFGVPIISRAGAIGFLKEINSVPNAIYMKYLMSGCDTLKADLSTTRHSIIGLQKNENRGALTTPKISAQAITDNYQYLTLKYANLFSGNDKIIVKKRSEDRKGLPFISYNEGGTYITWTDTTTFTITNPAFANVRVGDEVFFIQGEASGYTVHISSITESSGTYTVIIDEAIPTITATNKSHILVNNWQKIGTITNTHESYPKKLASFPLTQQQKWTQFKFELRGEGVQIEDITLTQKPAN